MIGAADIVRHIFIADGMQEHCSFEQGTNVHILAGTVHHKYEGYYM
jgi:hypothetical protein